MYRQTFSQPHMDGAPTELEMAMQEVEMSLSRGTLSRQGSTGSSAHRPRPSRITKPRSAGNSPQHVQRRKTVATNRAARSRSELYPYRARLSQDSSALQPQQLDSDTSIRPTSWHPSSIDFSNSNYLSAFDVSFSHLADYQTVDVNGMPTPMTQPELSADMPVDQWLSLENEASRHQSFDGKYVGYPSAFPPLDTTYPNGYITDPIATYPMSGFPISDAYCAFSPMNDSTRTWRDSLSSFPAYTAPPTPDFLPIQKPVDPVSQSLEVPPLTRKLSVELIGLGLYDAPSNTGFLARELIDGNEPSFEACSEQGQLGKGLKLEETWEPPEEGDEQSEDGEHDYADDEDENEDEACKAEAAAGLEEESVVARKDNESQPTMVSANETLPQTRANMSNQSFFFENDFYQLG